VADVQETDLGCRQARVDAHAAALELFAARWTTAPGDCVQEAFVELAGRSDEPEHVGAWLFRVVRNRALNAARSDRRRREREQVAARLRSAEANGSLASTLDAATLVDALDTLPRDSYEVVILRIWSGLLFEDIAAVLDCSVSTAHRRYRRALEHLRDVLEPPSCHRENSLPKGNSQTS